MVCTVLATCSNVYQWKTYKRVCACVDNTNAYDAHVLHVTCIIDLVGHVIWVLITKPLSNATEVD